MDWILFLCLRAFLFVTPADVEQAVSDCRDHLPTDSEIKIAVAAILLRSISPVAAGFAALWLLSLACLRFVPSRRWAGRRSWPRSCFSSGRSARRTSGRTAPGARARA